MGNIFDCAECVSRACNKGGEYPDQCPSVTECTIIDSAVTQAASDSFAREVMSAAMRTPRNDDGSLRNRMEEIIAFCKEMNFSTIGIAFCVALGKEARVLSRELTNAEFNVVPVCCKVGRVGLSDLGPEVPCARKGSSCNPVTQAAIMNSRSTDLNIILGLCVGHDILFTKYSSSPVTTIVVKDRALRHNTAAAMQESKELLQDQAFLTIGVR